MNIIGKEFRQMKSTPTIQENDVQGTMYSELMWGFLYIYIIIILLLDGHQ